MGMNPNQLNNASRHSGGRTSLSEINVTPFVDVLLVLLIVFMVSAPLMQQGIEVNLPKANAGSLPQSEDPVVLSIRAVSRGLVATRAALCTTASQPCNASRTDSRSEMSPTAKSEVSTPNWATDVLSRAGFRTRNLTE